MFFPYTAEEASKALGQIRRLRHRGNWTRIGSSDSYWTSPFLAVLVETVESFLLEKPGQAYELSRQGILLAQRIRAEDCPGQSAAGKRSLQAWAHAVHCSSCRALERLTEADSAIHNALALTRKPVFAWANGEVWRRFAALLLSRGSASGFPFVNQAIDAYAGFPGAQADALVLRGLFHQCLNNDPSAAARDQSQALELLGASRSPREERTWMCAIHNLAAIYANGSRDLATLEDTLKQVRRTIGGLSRHEPYRRMLCLWVEAWLMAPLGATRKAERLLTKVCEWLFRHQHYRQGALCSVDRALILIRDGEVAAAKEILLHLPEQIQGGEAPLFVYLEHRLASGLLESASEASLAELREALATIARRSSLSAQPLGIMYGPSSAEGGSAAGSEGDSSAT